MEIDYLGENASELINKLSRQLEHSRYLNDLFVKFVSIEESAAQHFFLSYMNSMHYSIVARHWVGAMGRCL